MKCPDQKRLSPRVTELERKAFSPLSRYGCLYVRTCPSGTTRSLRRALMSDQRIEREARFEQTGITGLQRDKIILDLKRRRWSEAKIAKAVGMTPAAVHYALKRLTGKPRPRAREEVDEMEVPTPDVPEEQW
jgi:transcriptional regulator with GAF, ATPase, and Fis domain